MIKPKLLGLSKYVASPDIIFEEPEQLRLKVRRRALDRRASSSFFFLFPPRFKGSLLCFVKDLKLLFMSSFNFCS